MGGKDAWANVDKTDGKCALWRRRGYDTEMADF